MESQTMGLMAILQVIGHRLRPGIDPDRYVDRIFSAVLGAGRLSLLHPGLIDVEVAYRGDRLPLLAASVDALFKSMTEPWEEDGSADLEVMAPPLDPPG